VRDVSVRWHTAVVFCRDARALSRWWAEVLGWQVGDELDDGRVFVLPAHLLDQARDVPVAERGPGLEFVQVDEDWTFPERTYLTLAPLEGGDHLAEIARLEALGATVVTEPADDSVDYWILDDPEGNGFSVYKARG
jgi:catechol 2,3-dioxygenase-like lactoylglutathione lyase family enzyme